MRNQAHRALLVLALFYGGDAVGATASRDLPCMDICNSQTPCDQPCDGMGNGATNCGEWGACEPDPNQCAPLWWEEVSRTQIGHRSYWSWAGFNNYCADVWRVTARDINCGWPDRDFCEKEFVEWGTWDGGCTYGGAPSLGWGQKCDEAILACFRDSDCN
jgi:hypothetical protein